MEQIKLIEPQKKYADDIWEFRQEILECDAENEASEKTILANGGVYEKTIAVDGCEMKRFWITV